MAGFQMFSYKFVFSGPCAGAKPSRVCITVPVAPRDHSPASGGVGDSRPPIPCDASARGPAFSQPQPGRGTSRAPHNATNGHEAADIGCEATKRSVARGPCGALTTSDR